MTTTFAPDGAAGAAGLGDLPTWDLADLYPAMDSPEFLGDLAKMDAEAKSFAAISSRVGDRPRHFAVRRSWPALGTHARRHLPLHVRAVS